MVLKEKTPENVLQEELLREKAEVLSRAGESVSTILRQLHNLKEDIEALLLCLHGNMSVEAMNAEGDMIDELTKRIVVEQVNGKIARYNDLREDAKLRYHYLIITREALGMRRHHWVEEFYKIPERKGYLHEL